MNTYGFPTKNFLLSSHLAIVFVKPISSSHLVKMEKKITNKIISLPKPCPTTSLAVPYQPTLRTALKASLARQALQKSNPKHYLKKSLQYGYRIL